MIPGQLCLGPAVPTLLFSHSVISDSSRSPGLQQTRLLCPTWKQICSRHCCSAVPDPLHFTPSAVFSFLFPFLGTALGLFLQEPGAASHLSPHPMYGILVPRPGIEPMSLTLEGRFLTTGSPGNSPLPPLFVRPFGPSCVRPAHKGTHTCSWPHTLTYRKTHT